MRLGGEVVLDRKEGTVKAELGATGSGQGLKQSVVVQHTREGSMDRR